MNQKDLQALKALHGESAQGNFYIHDTIGVPHPYCVGPAHVRYAADNFAGLLSAECIEAAEAAKVTSCNICKGQLTYKQHETALVIGCKVDTNKDNTKRPELQEYLMKLVPAVEALGLAGFVFMTV